MTCKPLVYAVVGWDADWARDKHSPGKLQCDEARGSTCRQVRTMQWNKFRNINDRPLEGNSEHKFVFKRLQFPTHLCTKVLLYKWNKTELPQRWTPPIGPPKQTINSIWELNLAGAEFGNRTQIWCHCIAKANYRGTGHQGVN